MLPPSTGARNGPWPHSDVAIVIPIATGEAMWEPARRYDVAQGGRYGAWTSTVTLYAPRNHGSSVPLLSRMWDGLTGSAGPVPVGSFSAAFHTPTTGQTTIYRLEWDPRRGGSEVAVRRAIDELGRDAPQLETWQAIEYPEAD